MGTWLSSALQGGHVLLLRVLIIALIKSSVRKLNGLVQSLLVRLTRAVIE